MSRIKFPINEMKRATATALLTVGVGAAFFGVTQMFDAPLSAKKVEVETPSSPTRPWSISASPTTGDGTARRSRAR